MGAGRALALRGQQPDLLVVADRAGRGPRQLGDLADAEGAGLAAHDATAASTGSVTCGGRSIDTTAPSSDVAASHHSAVCMLWMNGSSWRSDRLEARPEKICSSTSFGTAEVTIAITKAIDRTAPVFCSIVRAPAAIPRRCTGTVPIIAAVLGELNMPEPRPTMPSHSALSQNGESATKVPMPASPTAVTIMPSAASHRDPRRSAYTPANGELTSMPSAIGASLMPAVIG